MANLSNSNKIIRAVNSKQDVLTIWENIDINNNVISATNAYIITESDVTITRDDTKWVAPYNTSYWYTNIEINANAWIKWIEWAIYCFVCDSSWVVSANRNARIRICNAWDRIPFFSSSTSILAANSYLIATQTRLFVYKTTNSTAALHMINDTTYSALTASNVTSANTTAKVVSWKVFKDSVTALAVLLTWDQTVAGTKTFSTSPVVPSKTSAATNTGTAIATEAQVYLKANDNAVVKLTGNQTVAWTKTFSTSPVVPSKTADVANTWTAIATEAQVYKILPTVMTASEYSQVSNPVAGKIYFIIES